MSTVTEWRLTSPPVTDEQASYLARSDLVRGIRGGDTVSFSSHDEKYLRAHRKLLTDVMGLRTTLESRTVTTTEWTEHD